MEDFSTYFQENFPNFYSEIYDIYLSDDEPMPELRKGSIEEICSIFHSSTYYNTVTDSQDVKKICTTGSYISIMIATRQILENGNKRLSFFVLYAYLKFSGYELNLEKGFYANFISNIIEQLDKCEVKTIKKTRDKVIKLFSKEIEGAVQPIADGLSPHERKLGGRHFPFNFIDHLRHKS